MILGGNMEEKRHFTWLKILILILIIISAIVFYAFYYGPKGINVKEINVINEKIPTSFYGYKIVQLSDIHYKTTVDKSDLKKIIKKVNKVKPNIVIISGDILDKKVKYTSDDVNDLVDALNTIEAKYQYVITGDHDFNQKTFKDVINKTSFKLLDNTYDIIYDKTNDAMLIGGISTQREHIDVLNKVSTIEDAIKTNDTKYNILIMHEPNNVEDINKDNFQLILAGHTHNGELNIPYFKKFIIPRKDNSYTELKYQYGDSVMYISSGIGTTNIKARIFNKPSFNLYRLLNK